MKLAVSVLAVVAFIASAASARAQGTKDPVVLHPGVQTTATWTLRTADYTEQHVQGDQVIQFTGDELAAPPGGPYGTTVRRPPGVLRAGLLRPRVNFFPELLKTVENL